MVNGMKNAVRFFSISPAIAAFLMLFAATSPALAQSSKADELSEIVPVADDLFPEAPNKLPEDIVAGFLASDNVTLYVVSDDEGAAGPIQDYKVLGKARIKKKETAAVIEDLKKSLTDQNGVAMCGLCFHAHHVLRAAFSGHTYDLMICYPCSQVLTYGTDSTSMAHLLSANWMNGSPEVLKRIATAHGLPKPQVFIDEEINARHDASVYARWLRAMPESLRPFYPRTLDPSGNHPSPDIGTLREALVKQYPGTKRRILALFVWYGAPPWGEYADDSAERLLQDYLYSDLWSAVQSDRLTNAQLEGATRFFASKYVDRQEQHSRQALQDGIRSYSAERAHWLQIMPASVRPLWNDEMWGYRDFFEDTDANRRAHANEQPMLDALSQEFPDKNQRILVLFDWYGSDVADNRTFGRYQAVVDDLLQQFSTSELAQALQSTTLTEQQLDGAVRLFAESSFREARRKEIRDIPPALKEVLWARGKKDGNELIFRLLYAQSRPTPGDGIVHPFVAHIVPDDDYVAFVTVEETQLEPQFAALMVPGTPVNDSFAKHTATDDAGRACMNTGKARYLINTNNVMLFEILADCGNLARGYRFVICSLAGDLRCLEPPDWYFAGRSYLLTSEGVKVDHALHAWQDPIETPKRLQAVAARITAYNDRSSKRHPSRGRWTHCHTLDPPNLTRSFPCPDRDNSAMCKDFPNVDGIRAGDVIDMNSPVGNWIKQQSKDPDASEWVCWIEPR
jgi:hypothetical protein